MRAASRAAAAAVMAVASPAAALPAELKPLIDARLRYESVDQDGLPRDASAVTLRVRPGVEVRAGDFALLAEAEVGGALGERYNSGLNQRTSYPLVADPETAELNRLQLQYRGIAKTVVTVGRQRITLDDHRFVGNVGWRQNEQTFDAARLEWTGPKGIKADLSYAWKVRTIWGSDGEGARPTAISGDNVLANVSAATPIGTLTGFAYLVDQDAAAVAGARLSSKSFGARLAGARPLRAARLDYALSYARQSDRGRNPNDYAADYLLADAGLTLSGLRIGAGYEQLGGDDGRPLTSFQTPLATLHKFQGWADKFLVTPPDGIRDHYASATYALARPFAGAGPLILQALFHRFTADRRSRRYGDEWNLLASLKLDRFTLTGKYADYRSAGFATDTRKAWLQVEWSL